MLVQDSFLLSAHQILSKALGHGHPTSLCMGIVLVQLSAPGTGDPRGPEAALSGHFLAVSRGTIDFFLKKTTKKTLSPIQAVFALELKALRPPPAPGSFSFSCSRKGC